MNEDFKIQLSVKIPSFQGDKDSGMLNIRAASVKEFHELMSELDITFVRKVHGDVRFGLKDQDDLDRATKLVEGTLGGKVEVERPTVPATAPSGPGRDCVHGAMKLKEGRSAKGGWAAYFCAERDRTAQCKPVDAVTGVSWK
jgi:hypothetical protein